MRGQRGRAAFVPAPEMQILVGDPALLLHHSNYFRVIWQFDGIGEVRADRLSTQQLEADCAIVITSVDLANS